MNDKPEGYCFIRSIKGDALEDRELTSISFHQG